MTEPQILVPHRFGDRRDDMQTTFNRVRGNMTKGGLHGRNRSDHAIATHPVNDINQSVKLNRALWVLAEEMRRPKG